MATVNSEMSSSDCESDGDSDSSDEILIKQYFCSFSDRIRQAKVQISSKNGLKRQPGHYHLRDCRHADVEPRRSLYEGKHWEVHLPYQLQRSTPRLTRYLIRKLIKQQQKSIDKSEQNQVQKLAMKLLNPVVTEFNAVIVYNRHRLDRENSRHIADVEKVKDSVHWEMLRKMFSKQHNEEAEEERKRRVKLLNGLLDNARRTPSTEDLVHGMAETNYKRSLLNKDLTEAQENLENGQNEMNHDYQLAMSEMLDESLGKVVHTFTANETNVLCDEEQRRRVAEQNSLHNPSGSQKTKMDALMELKKAFEEVENEEQREEQKERERLIDLKAAIQEQLIRKVASKWIDVAIAEERARRIQEAENVNPAINRMRHMVSRVQRQMILEKFRGQWVSLTNKLGTDAQNKADKEVETDVDKHLRKQRENQRRAISVKSGVDI